MELIQKMMLRPESIETAEKMYFSGRDYCYLRDRRAILVKKNGMIDTGTYFNAFSVEKIYRHMQPGIACQMQRDIYISGNKSLVDSGGLS